MLHYLQPEPIPELFILGQQYKDDTRTPKMDLGLGVFCDAHGNTPIFSAVKKAERYITDTETTKTYRPLTGHPGFRDTFTQLVLGDSIDSKRMASCATPGGTGAFRMLLVLIHKIHPDATLWIPNVTWVNHISQAQDVGLAIKKYAYYNQDTMSLDFDGLQSDLARAKPNDVVLLHGCCHNPSGADLTMAQWQDLTVFLKQHGLLPMIDIAYQGFGEDLETDAQGMRYMVQHSQETYILASGSKNFGLYRERVGIAITVSSPDTAPIAQSHMATISRLMWSMPPEHGAKIIDVILRSPDLRMEWSTELDDMRAYIKGLRTHLSDTFRKHTNTHDFDFLVQQNGMFSMLPITPQQVQRLKDAYAIYMLPTGRASIASMKADLIEYFVTSYLAVIHNR